MMLPKYLPSLFKENPPGGSSCLKEQETLLLKSLGNKSAVEYETLIEEFAKDLDIRAEIIRTKLMGFETSFERIRLNELKDEIFSFEQNYEVYISKLREITESIQERKYTLAGLECAISESSDDSELMEYFMCNKKLSIIKVTGTAIEFVVHGYADIYDADAFEQYVGNHGGFMYTKLNPAITKPQMEKLYRAIFNDNKYKLRICAAYSADMKTGLKALQEYMKKRDYVGAIDQAVVSARNLNFYDSTVIAAFAGVLSKSGISCIEKSDNTLLTPLEAIKELERSAE